jgi:hypothetical protein
VIFAGRRVLCSRTSFARASGPRVPQEARMPVRQLPVRPDLTR